MNWNQLFCVFAVGYIIASLYAFVKAAYRITSRFDYGGDTLFVWFDRGVIALETVAVTMLVVTVWGLQT